MEVYHNPRCGKSRAAIEYLTKNKHDFEVIEYLKEIPTKDELKQLLQKLNMSAEQLLRKNEAIYKEKYKGKNYAEEEWINIMIENPKLIERPIVVNGKKAVVARPTEKIEEIV